MSHDSVTPVNPQLFLGEMALYYEEIRNINDRSLLYVRTFGILALSLAAYIFFGLRLAATTDLSPQQQIAASGAATLSSSTQPQIPASHAQSAPPAQLAAAASAYALIGFGLTAFLQFICCYSLIQYGRSRVHKIRYWRSISVLRGEFHRAVAILPRHGRAIPLQTGLELGLRKNYEGATPLPLIRRREYNFGYFLAALSLALFMVPAVYFASVWEYAHLSFFGPFEAYSRGVSLVAPLGSIVAYLVFKFAIDMCQELKGAQFATDRMIDPTVEDRPFSRDEQVMILLLRLTLVVWTGVYSAAVVWHLCSPEQRHLPSMRHGWMLISIVLFERVLTTLFKQHSPTEFMLHVLAKVLRLGTREEHSLAIDVLARVVPTRWISGLRRYRHSQRTIRPRGDVMRVICEPSDGMWVCYHKYRPEVQSRGMSAAEVIRKLSLHYKKTGCAQERADLFASARELAGRRARRQPSRIWWLMKASGSLLWNAAGRLRRARI